MGVHFQHYNTNTWPHVQIDDCSLLDKVHVRNSYKYILYFRLTRKYQSLICRHIPPSQLVDTHNGFRCIGCETGLGFCNPIKPNCSTTNYILALKCAKPETALTNTGKNANTYSMYVHKYSILLILHIHNSTKCHDNILNPKNFTQLN